MPNRNRCDLRAKSCPVYASHGTSTGGLSFVCNWEHFPVDVSTWTSSENETETIKQLNF